MILCSRPPRPTTSTFIGKLPSFEYNKSTSFTHIKKLPEIKIILVFKVSHSCENHRYPMFITCINGILITFRTTWLNNRCNSCLCSGLHCIWHGEECIGRHDRLFRFYTSLLDSYICSSDTIHLTRTYPNCLLTFCQYNSV